MLETKEKKTSRFASAQSVAADAMTASFSRFRGEPVPATGFSIGVSRLQAALTIIGRIDIKPEFGPSSSPYSTVTASPIIRRWSRELRNANIRAELYLGNPKNMGNQLKYADKRNSPCVIIQGSDEKDDPAGPQVVLRT